MDWYLKSSIEGGQGARVREGRQIIMKRNGGGRVLRAWRFNYKEVDECSGRNLDYLHKKQMRSRHIAVAVAVVLLFYHYSSSSSSRVGNSPCDKITSAGLVLLVKTI